MALMKHTLLFLALAALLTFTLALPLSPLASEDLVSDFLPYFLLL